MESGPSEVPNLSDFNLEEFDSFLDRCTDSWTCPLCAQNGVTARVECYQVNDFQALYFCETKDCLYPQNDDDADPVIVKRSLVEMPVTASALEKLGFPTSLLEEGGLTYKLLFDLSVIRDAYKDYDEWARLEKELLSVKTVLEGEIQKNNWTKDEFSSIPKCTPLNYFRNMDESMIKYVRHFIPNIHEIIDLLKMDLL